MTQISIDFRDSFRVGTEGSVEFYTLRRAHVHGTTTDFIILPHGKTVAIAGGVATLDLPADDGATYCWVARELMGPGSITRYFHVPSSPSVLKYADLQDVNPKSLQPGATPPDAWWIALAEVGTPTPEAIEAALDAYLAANPITSGFEYVQDAPVATWTIPVPLAFGRAPSVQIIIGGEVVLADVRSTPQLVTATFPVPYSGIAILT